MSGAGLPGSSAAGAGGEQDRLLYQGDMWVRLDTLPRLLAEGWRRTLAEGGVVSMVRTPFDTFGLLALEGTYMGDVGLYVPEVQFPEALELLGLSEESSTDSPE